MNTLAWLDESFSLRLAATLLHFVWQGLAVALIVVATGWLLKRAAAQVRYSINVAVMLVLVACLPVTFAWVDVPQPVAESDGTRSPMTLQPSDSNRLADGAIAMLDGPGVLAAESDLALSPMRDTDPPKSEAETVDAEASRAKPVVQIPSETKPAFSWLHPIAPYLTLIYFAGVILMLVRLAKALWGGQNLRRAAIPVADQHLLSMIERQARRIGMKIAPAVALCEHISIPVVVGVVKPMILLPAALASGLSPDQLQALVTHELAHIRRFDLLVNLLQRLIEAVLFFHPAVWFISRRVSVERENAADDMVLAAGWQRANYADALVRMAELSSSLRQTRIANQATALAATGTNSSDFKRRVLRLLENTEPPNLRLTRGGILTMVLVSASLLVTPVIVQTWADNHERQVSNLSESGDEAVVQTKSGGSRSEDVRGQETRARQAGDGAYEKKPKKLGTLTGRFFFDGEPPKPEKLVPPPARRPPFNATNRPNGGWLDWHRFRDLGLTDQSLIVGKEGGIKNILIWIRSRDVPVAPRTRPVEKPVLRMKDGQFQPRVLAFQVPQTLVLKNESTHLTNFHWQPIHNEPFNVVVASKHSREVTIAKPEFFARFLNNDCQPWTNSWLFPCAHPYFAVTAADGTFRIENLPPGEWEFQVWHERAGYVQRDNWPKGRFTLKIEAGKNDLGVIKLPAGLFDEKHAGERREKREQRNDAQAENGDRFAAPQTDSKAKEPRSARPSGDKQSDAVLLENGSSTDTPPLERRVSLKAERMRLKAVLEDVCQQAGISLELDVPALQVAGLKLDERVTINIDNESLQDALLRLIVWDPFTGIYYEVRNRKLFLSTLPARQKRTLNQLPDWLKPLYNHGLLANVDDEGNVVSVTASQVMNDDLLAKLKTLPKLRKLHIEVTNTITPAGLAHLAELTALEKLELYSVNRGGHGLGDAAIRSVIGLKSLRELSVSECGTTDAGVRLLESMPWLTHLNLYQEGRLTDAAIASIAKLKRLKHLDLNSYVATVQYGRMRFSETGIRHLAGLKELEVLRVVGHAVPADVLAFPRLTSLSLGGPEVDDDCAARIAECRHLKSLTLSYTGITDAGLKQIAAVPTLSQLNLDSHVITDAGIEHLKRLPALKHLNLRASQVTDKSLRHLAEIKTLTRLDLHGSGQPGSVVGERFTINGLQQLKALPKLRTLWLTNFRSPGGYLGLKELTQLRELSLTMADIGNDELDALEDALPHTTIHAMSGGSSRLPRRLRRVRRRAD